MLQAVQCEFWQQRPHNTPGPVHIAKKLSGRACSSDINLSSCQFSNLHHKLRGVIIIPININRKPHCDFEEYLSFRSNIASSCARVTSDSEYTCIYQEKYFFLLCNRLNLRKPRPFNLNVITVFTTNSSTPSCTSCCAFLCYVIDKLS